MMATMCPLKDNILRLQESAGGHEGHRAHRAVGGRDGARVLHAQLPLQQEEGVEGDDAGDGHAEQQLGDERRAQVLMRQLLPALEADGEEQLERDELDGGGRDLQVALHQVGHDAQGEEEQGGVGEVREEQGDVHAA
jgi:hypothetical protein